MARRIRAQEYNGNTYFTSGNGVLKLEAPTLAYKPAGLPRGLDLTVAAVAGASIPANSSVAYRLIWGIRDANNNYIYGPPSTSVVFTSGGAATAVSVGFTIPAFITTAHFFQIYRSHAVASGVNPGDELFLCYERNPTAAEIAALAVAPAAVTDICDESLLGLALYTNATQEGLINENTAPPYCRDICLYRDHMIYAYTQIRQNLTINLIGTDAVPAGKNLTIAGVVYTGAAAENIAAGQYLWTNAGTPAQNVEATAKSLIRVINGFAANARVYAYYVSGFGEVPGKIYIESRNLGDATWQVTGVAAISPFFAPQLPAVANAFFTSSSDDTQNAIIISKFQQPEHVPYINKFLVGAKTEAIERVIALRDSVLIFKENSIWRLVGSSLNNFQISLLDNTVSVVGRDSISVLNNMAFAMTNQGIVAVSDNGVQIVSRQIEYDLLADIRYVIQNNLEDDPIGHGHESDRMYYITTPAVEDEGVYVYGKRITYAYNAFSQAWTRTYFNSNCYAVKSDRLYYGLNNNFGVVLEQRIGYADRTPTFPAEMEFADPEGTLSVTALGPGTNQITANFTDGVNWTGSINAWPTTPQRGWIILDQAGGRKYIVLNVVGNVYTLNSVVGIVAPSTLTIYRSIQMRAILSPAVFREPFTLKQFCESHFDLGTMSAYEFDLYFYNEEDSRGEPVSTFFTPQTTQTRIALDDFVTTTLNAPYVPHNIKRTYVNKERSIGTRLFVEIFNQVSGSRFEINAVGLDVRAIGSNKVSQ